MVTNSQVNTPFLSKKPDSACSLFTRRHGERFTSNTMKNRPSGIDLSTTLLSYAHRMSGTWSRISSPWHRFLTALPWFGLLSTV